MLVGRYRIEARPAPGMTTHDAAKRQPATPTRTVHTKSFESAERAGRGKAAAVGQHRRDQVTVKENEALKTQAHEAIEEGESGTGDGQGPLPRFFASSARAERNSTSRSKKPHVSTADRATST